MTFVVVTALILLLVSPAVVWLVTMMCSLLAALLERVKCTFIYTFIHTCNVCGWTYTYIRRYFLKNGDLILLAYLAPLLTSAISLNSVF